MRRSTTPRRGSDRRVRALTVVVAAAAGLGLALSALAAEQKTSDKTKEEVSAKVRANAPAPEAAPAAGEAKKPAARPAEASLTTDATGAGKAKKYFPEGTPTRAIQELDDMLDDFTVAEKGKELTASEHAHNTQLKQKIIHGTFDLTELSRQSLGAHWGKITQSDRDRFVGLLTDLLEQKALFSKEQSAAKSKSGGKYFVIYRGHRFDDKGESRSFVKTKVVVPAENVDIELNYRLKKEGGDWKIYDIVVDEASLVDNYRYQFDSIIQKNGFPDLIRRMSEKLAEIKGKRDN